VTIAFAASIYLVIWWTVLFAVLPIGVRTSEEEDEQAVPGAAESAPHTPHLLPKMIATTVLSSIVFAVVWLIIVDHVITLDDIPFLPHYEHIQ
jgi:predicted secreted protein